MIGSTASRFVPICGGFSVLTFGECHVTESGDMALADRATAGHDCVDRVGYANEKWPILAGEMSDHVPVWELSS